MDIFLYSKTPDLSYAAATLADLQALIAALADPSNATNAATIARVQGALQQMVQNDSGEPLRISSYDDASTLSAWVTDIATSLAVGLGDADPSAINTYAGTSSFTISSPFRLGTLALNTTQLSSALSGRRPHTAACASGWFTLQIRKTDSTGTVTVGMIPIQVSAGVLATTPQTFNSDTYLTLAQGNALYMPLIPASISLAGTAGLGFVDLPAQSSDPAAPASQHIRIFANSANKFSWIGASGYVRNFDGTLSASRVYTLPDADTKFPIIPQAITVTGPTAARTWTVPDANFTLARTDAGQTFTGTQAFGVLTATGGTHTGLTSLGIRSTGAAFDLTLASIEVFTAGRTLTLALGDAARTLTLSGNASLSGLTTTGTGTLATTTGKTLTFSNTLTLAGTDSTTMTFPTTSATLARIDAANTFAGIQTFSNATEAGSGVGSIVTSGGIATAKALFVASTTASTSSTTGSGIFGGGIGVAGKIYNGDSTPATSPSTGSILTAGGIATSRGSFMRGISVSGDRSAISVAYFVNQSVDPAAFSSGIDITLSASGATAGSSSTTLGINNTVQLTAGALSYATVYNYYAQFNITNGAIIANAAGFATSAFDFSAATVTNGYGLRVGNVIGAASNYAIKTGLGLVNIGDSTEATSTTGSFVSAGGGSFVKKVFASSFGVGANQVVGARITGYTAMTGSPDKATAYATGSVTLAQLAGRVAQLQADMTTHGFIGA